MVRRTEESLIATLVNLASSVLTAAPIVCIVALIFVFGYVRLILGSWPLVYGDDAGDWFVMSAGVIAFGAYVLSLAGLLLWAPVTGLAARLLGRPLFIRRLVAFAAGWALIGAIYAFDQRGSLTSFLR